MQPDMEEKSIDLREKEQKKRQKTAAEAAAQISVTVEDPGSLLDADTPEAYEKLKLLL